MFGVFDHPGPSLENFSTRPGPGVGYFLDPGTGQRHGENFPPVESQSCLCGLQIVRRKCVPSIDSPQCHTVSGIAAGSGAL